MVFISYYDIVIHYVWKHISMYLVGTVTIQQSSSNLYANHPRIVWVSQRWLIMTFLVGHKVTMVVIGYAFHITISLYLYVMFETYFYVSSKITISHSSSNLYSKSPKQYEYEWMIVVHIISFLFAVYCCVYSSSFDIKGIICTLSDTIFASIICHIIILCGTQKVDCCMYVCYSVGVLCCSIEYPQAGCIDFCIHHIYRHNVIICPE